MARTPKPKPAAQSHELQDLDDELSESTSQDEAVTEPDPAPRRTIDRTNAADIFDEAADAFASRLYLVTEPKIEKPASMGGGIDPETNKPIYLNQAEMYYAYNGHLSKLRNTITDDLMEPQRTICMRYVRMIQEAADGVRFPPADVPRPNTVILKQKENLKRTIANAKAQCREALMKAGQLKAVG